MRSDPDSGAASDVKTLAEVCKGLLQVVRRGRTLEWLRNNQEKALATPRHRALLYGVTRHYFALHGKVSAYLTKPLRSKDQDLHMLLLVGAYQLLHSDKPAHASVNGAVTACSVLGKPWARGLVNGVLRQLHRDLNANSLPQTVGDNNPEWLVDKISQQYPEFGSNILRAMDQRAPMVLRVNTTQTSTTRYRQLLDQQGVTHLPSAIENALVLDTPRSSASLPGWQAGHVAVQELAAQCAVQVLLSTLPEDLHNPTVLDACCAPGGKLFQLHEGLSERYSQHRLIGNDQSASRLADTKRIGERLGHSEDPRLYLQCGDATDGDTVSEFCCDAILLDAPCSGSGTIRRNPDIRVLLQPAQISAQQSLQLLLLNNLWRGLSQGGTLLYSTCSVFDEENDQVIQQFVSANGDAVVIPLQLPYGHATQFGWQMLPTEPLTDGFYYATIRKVAQR